MEINSRDEIREFLCGYNQLIIDNKIEIDSFNTKQEKRDKIAFLIDNNKLRTEYYEQQNIRKSA